METKEALQKLTAVQLREKLKGRNLATTGTKSELVERLYESFQEEENLLSGSGVHDDLNVDDLLGSSLDEHSLSLNEEALLLGSNPEPKAATPTVVKSPLKQKQIVQMPIEKKPTVSTTLGGKDKLAERAKRFGVPLNQTGKKVAKISSADDEAKQRRMQRFGTK